MRGENRTCLTQAHRASSLKSGRLARVGTVICGHAAIRNLWETAKVLTSLPRLWLYWELEQLSQEERVADSGHPQALGGIIHSASLEWVMVGKDLEGAALNGKRDITIFIKAIKGWVCGLSRGCGTEPAVPGECQEASGSGPEAHIPHLWHLR